MITARGVSVRAGARLLLDNIDVRISAGDRIGLIGRNGAGKTSLARVLAKEVPADAGSVMHAGSVGFLSQEPSAGAPEHTGAARVLAARGLDDLAAELRAAEHDMSILDGSELERALCRYSRAEAEFVSRGGYAAEAAAAQVALNLGLDESTLAKPLGALSGGQRRRVELARVLFADHDILLLDEPTNHLDADSLLWLRGFLAGFTGGLVVISHDEELLRDVVNRVHHLDPNRRTLDDYHVGWDRYLATRRSDEQRRRRERVNAERKAESLVSQADRMRAGVKTAVAAKNMVRRANRMLAELEPERRTEKVARLRLPEPAPCGRVPVTARDLNKVYGDHEVFRDVEIAVDRGSRVAVLGCNGAGKTTLLRILAGVETPDRGIVERGHGARVGYYAQEHETLDRDRSVLQNLVDSSPGLTGGDARLVLGSFLFSGDDVEKPAGVLSGGEKTRLALASLVSSSANVLLLDEPTNNLDPASREEILGAIGRFRGSIVMVTHDPDAVDALRPDRVLLLPDGTEDLWRSEHRDLVSLS